MADNMFPCNDSTLVGSHGQFMQSKRILDEKAQERIPSGNGSKELPKPIR